jgi:predicted nucleotidyltransferase component of viral defense system
LEILTNLQKKILHSLSLLPDKDAFYLTGGTALSAIFLKHRRSNDLDFFTNIEELILPLSQKLEATLIKEGFKVERLRGFHSFVELSVSSDNDSTDDSPDLHLLARSCTINDLKEFFRNWKKDILKEIAEK